MKTFFYLITQIIISIHPSNQIELLKTANNDQINRFIENNTSSIKQKSMNEKQCLTIRIFFKSIPNENEVLDKKSKINSLITGPEKLGLQSFESFLVHFLEEILKDGKNENLNKGYDEGIDLNVKTMIQEKIQELKVKNDVFTDLGGGKIFEGNLSGEGSDKVIFDEIIDMYGVLTKILKENMNSFSQEQNQVSKTILNKKNEFNVLLTQIKNSYKELRNYVSSFQFFKDGLKHTITEKFSNSDRVNEYNKLSDFIRGLDDFPIASMDKSKITDLKTFFEDLTEEEFRKMNDETVIRIPFWEKTEIWNNEKINKRRDNYIARFESIFQLTKEVNDDLLLGSYKKLMVEAAAYRSPEIMAFEKKKEKLNLEDEYFDKDLKNFIVDIKKKIEESNYYKELIKDPSVIFLNGDYTNQMDTLNKWKLKILHLEKELNKNMVLLREKNEEIEFLYIEKHDEFEFVLANDQFIELQRRVGLAEASFMENQPILLEKYKDKTYLEIFEIWKQYYADYNNKESFKKNTENFENLNFTSRYTTFLKMSYYLKLLQMRQNLKEILIIRLAQALGQIQNMENSKKCLTLPDISLNIYKLIKTNLISFEKVFFDVFLSYHDFERTKKFITYNYMITENKQYSYKQIELLEQEDNSDQNLKIQKQKTFIENFTTNFSLFIGLIRNKSKFALNITNGASFTPKEVVKTILSIVNIDWEQIKGAGKQTINILMNKVLDVIVTLLITAIPFLSFIPFSKFILKKIGMVVFKLMFNLIKIIVNKVENEISNYQYEKKKMSVFHFDVDEILEDVKTEEIAFDMKQIQDMELKYIGNVQTSGFDFNSLEYTNIYHDDENYDVYSFVSEDYLEYNQLPPIDILNPENDGEIFGDGTGLSEERIGRIHKWLDKAIKFGLNTGFQIMNFKIRTDVNKMHFKII